MNTFTFRTTADRRYNAAKGVQHRDLTVRFLDGEPADKRFANETLAALAAIYWQPFQGNSMDVRPTNIALGAWLKPLSSPALTFADAAIGEKPQILIDTLGNVQDLNGEDLLFNRVEEMYFRGYTATGEQLETSDKLFCGLAVAAGIAAAMTDFRGGDTFALPVNGIVAASASLGENYQIHDTDPYTYIEPALFSGLIGVAGWVEKRPRFVQGPLFHKIDAATLEAIAGVFQTRVLEVFASAPNAMSALEDRFHNGDGEKLKGDSSHSKVKALSDLRKIEAALNFASNGKAIKKVAADINNILATL